MLNITWSSDEDYTENGLKEPTHATTYGYVKLYVHKVARPSLMTQHEKICVCHPSFV